MDADLLNNIEGLQDTIEELAQDFNIAISKDCSFDVLEAMRSRKIKLKDELAVLQLRLLDELPLKPK